MYPCINFIFAGFSQIEVRLHEEYFEKMFINDKQRDRKTDK